MARTVTLTNLVEMARRRADMIGDELISTSEGQDYVQESATALYDLLVDCDSEFYFSQSDLSPSSGATYVALPSDFYRLIKVGKVSGSDVIQMFPFGSDSEWDDWPTITSKIAGQIPRYRVRAGNLWFDGALDSAMTIRVQYVPTMPAINDSTSLFDGVNGWEEWIAIDAAIKMLRKEESPTVELERDRAHVEARIVKMRTPRDKGQPRRVARRYSRMLSRPWIRGVR